MTPSSVFIIVPAYNEGVVLRSTVEQLLSMEYKVVVVDDGSAETQKNHLTGLPVWFIRHRKNLGQGAALQTGALFAQKKGAHSIVHFDADGQHRAEDIPALLTELDNGADLVFGSRFSERKTNNIPLLKRAVIFIARYLNFLFTGILLSDAHNGLRAMTAKAASVLSLKENRMSHASEILFLAKKHHLKIKEVPVTILYTDYSKRKGQSVWNSIRIGFDLLLHKLFQ